MPLCFLTSFGVYILAPTYLLGSTVFGLVHIGHTLAQPFGPGPGAVELEDLQQQIVDDLDAYVLKWQALPPPPAPPPARAPADEGSGLGEARRDSETSSDGRSDAGWREGPPSGVRKGLQARRASCGGLQGGPQGELLARADSLVLLRQQVHKGVVYSMYTV